jgi:hypothetical protein
MNSSEKIRRILGVACVSAAIFALSLSLATDLAVFQYDNSPKLKMFMDSHDLIAIRVLACAAYVSLASLMASFFAEGWKRAVGISVSLATLFLCLPLGVGI